MRNSFAELRTLNFQPQTPNSQPDRESWLSSAIGTVKLDRDRHDNRSLTQSFPVRSIDMADESPTSKTAKPAATDAAVTKKEKPPAVEDKPFADFIQQDYIPALQKGLSEQGLSDSNIALERAKIAVKGFETAPECSQVIGRWNGGDRQFSIYFFDDNIQGQKGISVVDLGTKPSTIESFLIDERKITLDLLVFGLVRRLNSQKWLGIRN